MECKYMRIWSERRIRKMFFSLTAVMSVFLLLLEILVYQCFGAFSVPAALLTVCLTAAEFILLFEYLKRQDTLLENAVNQMKRTLSGNQETCIECNEDGEIFVLFHLINTLSSVLKAQAEREKQRSGFLKTTISDISHQLKTPLSALNIYNALMMESEDAGEIRRFVQTSENELDRMGNLINSLLKLARLDAGVIVLDKHPENIAEIMEELRQRFSCRAELEKKSLRFEGEERILRCDAGWLSEALGNILKNALDHTSQGGSITVRWETRGDLLNIRIGDNGSGIHPDDIHHIFKRFYRSRFSMDRQGLGLGLPLSKAIIEAHGGMIEVESQPGKGAVFSVNLFTADHR